MPPNSAQATEPLVSTSNGIATTGVLFEQDVETIDGGLAKNIENFKHATDRKLKFVWKNIIIFTYVHLAAIYGIYRLFTSTKWQTMAFSSFLIGITGFGVTAGVHRLWAHRSYKAKWPLRLMLMLFNAGAFQDSIYHWARDHRVHHKYSETDADPHNAMRGFFFSHIGWLMVKKNPEIAAKGKTIDLSDLKNDKIVMFQHRYYTILMPLCCFILPTIIPMYCWNESLTNSWFVATMLRWAYTLNITWLINSAAHKFGTKPYDKHMTPVENLTVAILAYGEGWHNFHHCFPWDYKTGELGYYLTNYTNAFIDFFAKIGWAYDLKTVSNEIIKKRAKRTGDGSHAIWGWGDKDQSKEEMDAATILHKKEDN